MGEGKGEGEISIGCVPLVRVAPVLKQICHSELVPESHFLPTYHTDSLGHPISNPIG